METHGRRGRLGPVAERVLREVARPLLIARGDANQPDWCPMMSFLRRFGVKESRLVLDEPRSGSR